MTIRDILIWPNPELLKVSAPIRNIDDSTRTLVKDLFDTMYAADGVGLAAPQIGVHQRVMVVDIHAGGEERPSGEPPVAMINPVFSSLEGKLTWEEGCLSVPGETGKVTRSAKCVCTYQDLDGLTHTIEAEGLMAVALQHECDHLDGKLFVDYLSPLKRGLIRKKMLKLSQES